jgi:ABC-2 type transport system permease protein
MSAAVVERVFPKAWSRGQEGRVHAGDERPLARWLRALTAPLPRTTGLLFAKDLAIFFRDTSQWSQLLLLLALIVVYVFNFSVLPVGDDTALGIVLRDVAAFCNLGLAAFVTTAVAVRFVYPMVSLEGRSWWILRSAPLALERVWWSKFWLGFLPLVLLGETLVAATNHFLGVGHGLTLLFGLTLLPLLAAVVSIGLAFGAAYPRLDTQNAAQIATSFGAIVYMVTCLGLIALVAALEAWPVMRLFWASSPRTAVSARDAAWIAACLAGALASCAAAFAWARRASIRSLARLPG